MENHYFDADGVYTASAPANPGTLPPTNAIRVVPPKRPGHWPVLNAAGNGWELLEDHRGEKGRLNGAHCEITALGPLPSGWNAESDPESPPALANDVSEAIECGRESDAGNTETTGEAPAPHGEQENQETREGTVVQYYLTRSGIYHVQGCPHTRAVGTWLSLEDIRAKNAAARPCGRCGDAQSEA